MIYKVKVRGGATREEARMGIENDADISIEEIAVDGD